MCNNKPTNEQENVHRPGRPGRWPNAMLWQCRAAAAPRPKDSDMGRPAPRRACCRGPFLSPCSWVGVRETLSVQRKLWAGRGMRDLLRAPGRGRHLCPPCWGVVPPCWGEGPGCWSRDGAHGAPLRRPPSLRLLPLGAAGGAERGPCVPSCAPTLPLAGMGSGSTEPGLRRRCPTAPGAHVETRAQS